MGFYNKVQYTMVGVKDVNQQHLTTAFANYLKKSGHLEVPEWADLVKTATFKEMSPYDRDWFYVRCAATMRHLYCRGNAVEPSLLTSANPQSLSPAKFSNPSKRWDSWNLAKMDSEGSPPKDNVIWIALLMN